MKKTNNKNKLARIINSSPFLIFCFPLLLYYTVKSVRRYVLESEVFKYALGFDDDNSLYLFFKSFNFNTYRFLIGFYLVIPIKNRNDINDINNYVRSQILKSLHQHIVELDLLDVSQLSTSVSKNRDSVRVDFYPATMNIMIKNLTEISISIFIYLILTSLIILYYA